MFSPYVCCARMCSGVARVFYGQNTPEIYTTFQVEKEKKIYKFPHFLKYKHLRELLNVQMPDNE